MDHFFNYIIWLLIILCFILLISITYILEEIYYNIFGRKTFLIDNGESVTDAMIKVFEQSTRSTELLYRWGLSSISNGRSGIRDYIKKNYISVKLLIQAIFSITIVLYTCYYNEMSFYTMVVNSSFFSLLFGLFFRSYISNYVHGLMIISYDTIKVRDFIGIAGYKGIVLDIGRFYTLLLSFKQENKFYSYVSLPNEYFVGAIEHFGRE